MLCRYEMLGLGSWYVACLSRRGDSRDSKGDSSCSGSIEEQCSNNSQG
jgi:hypothetical protein